MDKELDGIAPVNLDGTPAETVHTPSPEVAKEMSYNSKKAAENEFNWNSQEKVLYKMYDAIIG